MLVGGVFVPNDDQFLVQNYKKDSSYPKGTGQQQLTGPLYS